MARWLRIVAERALDLSDVHGVVDAEREQRPLFVRHELPIEAERDVRRERESRPGVREPAPRYPLVQLAQRSVGPKWEHDDVRLHEPHRTPELEREGRGGPRDGIEHFAQLIDRRCRCDWAGAGRPDDGDVRRHEARELWIKTRLYFQDQARELRLQGRNDIDTRPGSPAPGRCGPVFAGLFLHRMLGCIAADNIDPGKASPPLLAATIDLDKCSRYTLARVVIDRIIPP